MPQMKDTGTNVTLKEYSETFYDKKNKKDKILEGDSNLGL